MKYISLFFFLLLIILKSNAQNSIYKNEMGFKSENDAYLGIKQDRYYTNGLFISFRSAIKPSDTSKIIKKIWSLKIGQEMYNPKSGATYSIDAVDRPFAAYSYGSTSLQWLLKSENIFKAEIQFGITGPSAFGEEGQKFIHRTFGFYDIRGWQYQVKDEI